MSLALAFVLTQVSAVALAYLVKAAAPADDWSATHATEQVQS